MKSRKTVAIDFTKPLSDKDAKLLHEFLKQDELKEKGNKVKLFEQQVTNEYNKITFTLSHSLVRQTLTLPNSTKPLLDKKTGEIIYYYAIYDNDEKNMIGIGGFGKVFPVLAKLEHANDKMQLAFYPTKQVIKISDFKIMSPYYHDQVDTIETNQYRSKIKEQQEQELNKLRNENKIAVENAIHLGTKKMTIVKDREIRTKSLMVSDFLSGKTIHNLHSEWKTNPPPSIEIFQLSILLLEALERQISSRNIVHRDIKPENIMVDPARKPWPVNIMDVGQSAIINTDRELTGHSPVWLAPEALDAGEDFTILNQPASDTYSMGRVIRHLWDDETVKVDINLASERYGYATLMLKKSEAAKKNKEDPFTIPDSLRETCIAQGISDDAIKQYEKVITSITTPNRLQRGSLQDAINTLKNINFTPRSLETLIKNKSLTIEQRYAITIELIKQLKELHTQGKIHGDITPAAIMANIDKTPIEVTILNFGSVRSKDTKLQEIKGNLEYLPPEIAHDPSLANKTSDIYSLGLVLRDLWEDRSREADREYYNKASQDEIIDYQKIKYNNSVDFPVMLSKEMQAELSQCKSVNATKDLIKVLEKMTASRRSQRITLDHIQLDNNAIIPIQTLAEAHPILTSGLKGSAVVLGATATAAATAAVVVGTGGAALIPAAVAGVGTWAVGMFGLGGATAIATATPAAVGFAAGAASKAIKEKMHQSKQSTEPTKSPTPQSVVINDESESKLADTSSSETASVDEDPQTPKKPMR